MSRAVVDAKEFSHAMSKISKILKKCAIPILEEVCLRIQNGRCTLTATDLETWLTKACCKENWMGWMMNFPS